MRGRVLRIYQRERPLLFTSTSREPLGITLPSPRDHGKRQSLEIFRICPFLVRITLTFLCPAKHFVRGSDAVPFLAGEHDRANLPHPGHNLRLKMLVIELQLSQQEGRKKIEWNKSDPTFEELKSRLQQCGVPDDWCVEVLRGSSFVCPDLQTHIQGPKITVRASPILDVRAEEEHPDDIQWTQWMKIAFEKVVSHVGRVYLVDTTEEEDARCEVGTASPMDCHGECICALHCVYPAVENPERYKIHATFPNYQRGCLSFEAKPRIMDEDVDVCVIEPAQPLKKPYLPTSYLDLATDVREDDIIYCFFFPKDPLKHATPQVLQNLLMAEKSPLRALRPPDNPTILTGTVCFSEWMQGVAVYERPPDGNGGILVSRSGRVKGMHVKAFTCSELRSKVNSENPEELRVARKLCRKMSTYAPSDGIPVFVPPHGLVRLLGLEGGCELLQAALRQNKMRMKMQVAPKPPKPPRSSRSTRSRCSTPHKSRTSNKRRRSSVGKKVSRQLRPNVRH